MSLLFNEPAIAYHDSEVKSFIVNAPGTDCDMNTLEKVDPINSFNRVGIVIYRLSRRKLFPNPILAYEWKSTLLKNVNN